MSKPLQSFESYIQPQTHLTQQCLLEKGMRFALGIILLLLGKTGQNMLLKKIPPPQLSLDLGGRGCVAPA